MRKSSYQKLKDENRKLRNQLVTLEQEEESNITEIKNSYKL